MSKYMILWEIKEYVGNQYSRELGSKLRSKKRVNKIVKRLQRQNRCFVLHPWKISKLSIKPKPQKPKFEIKQWVDVYTFADTAKH